ncbi:MAG: nucleotide exchange factor GrpE [Nanoarchaeota archaeon]
MREKKQENKGLNKELHQEDLGKSKEKERDLEADKDLEAGKLESEGLEKSKSAKKAEPKKDSPQDLTVQDLTDLLQRTQANFENYRKQMEKRMEEVKQMACKDVISQVLPVVDNFELALKNFNENHNSKSFVEGVELIYSQLLGVLESNGIGLIRSRGEQFDPYYHEALVKESSSLPENEVIEEFQKGFTLHGKVIRHAKVKISAGKAGSGSKEDNDKNGEKDIERSNGKTKTTKHNNISEE